MQVITEMLYKNRSSEAQNAIRELLSSGKFTIELLIKLHDHTLTTLLNKGIQVLIHSDRLTADHCKDRESIFWAVQALEMVGVQELVNQGKITMDRLISWDSSVCMELRQVNTQKLIKEDKLTDKHLAEIKFPETLKALQDKDIRKLIDKRKMTIEQLVRLPSYACMALGNGGVRGLVEDDLLTADDLNVINTYHAFSALTDSGVRALVRAEKLTSEHLKAIQHDYAFYALQNVGVRNLLNKGHLAIKKFITLSGPACDATQCVGVQALLEEGKLTHEHLSSIKTSPASLALKNVVIQALVRDGKIAPAHIAAITSKDVYNSLVNPRVQRLVARNTLTIEQALQLTPYACRVLRDDLTADYLLAVKNRYASEALLSCEGDALVRNRLLTPDHIAAISSSEAVKALKSPVIQSVLSYLTPDHIAAISTESAYKALEHPRVQWMLKEGFLHPAYIKAITNDSSRQVIIKALPEFPWYAHI